METNEISQSHMKGEMLQYAVELCRHDTYMCVSWEEEWDSVPCVQTLWSPSKPHGSGCLLVCLMGLFWLPRALYAVSLLFTVFRVSPLSTDPSSHTKM